MSSQMYLGRAPNPMLAAGRSPPHARSVSSRQRVVSVQAKMKVVVTGAAGRTGILLSKKLAERKDEFEAVAVIRNDKTRAKVESVGVPASSIFPIDISRGDVASFKQAFEGADVLIMTSSAVPEIIKLSLIKVFWAKLLKQTGVLPDFGWKEGQTPEQVDWNGAKAQFDAAKIAGIKHVLVVGSMGGTEPDNMLNKLGGGNILVWKRKAEMYLMGSGLTYTIMHPGGLVDEPGGLCQLCVDVDDKLLKRNVRNISRDDVAELCLEVLSIDNAKNRSFDVIALDDEGSKGPTTDYELLISSLNGANCDYSINPPPP